MDQILLDKQPGLATSAIVGTLTLAKTGTTARTATFPDAAITVAGLEVANTFTTAQTIVSANGLTTRPAATQDSVRIQGRATGTNSYILTLTTVGALSASGTVYLPTVDGATVLATTSTPVAGHIPFSAGTNYAATLSTDLNFDVGTQTLRVGTISGSINTVILATAGTGGSGTARVRLGTSVREWEMKASASPYNFSIDYVGTDAPLANVLSFTKAGVATFIGAVTVANGTAAAPGIRLTSEASGLYRVGATSIGFAVAGTAAASLTSGGALSILAAGTGGSLAIGSTTEATGSLTINRSTVPNLAFTSGGGGSVRLQQANSATNTLQVTDNTGATVYFTVTPTAVTVPAAATLTCSNTTDATTTSDGSVVLSGGLSVAKNIVTGQSALFTATTAAGTTAGQLQRETNQDKLYAYANGIGGWMDKCLFSQYATVSQAGIVTDQSLASATARGTRTLPANFFKLGKVLKFRLCGRYTTDAAAGNATVQIKLGSTVFRTTGSFALDNSVTALPWTIEGEIVCQSTGATGTVEGVSVWEHMITGATGNWNAENLGGTAAVTIDTTASQAFDVIWTATDAGTTITCTCFRLWEVC